MYANIITKQQLFIVKICKYSMPLFLDLCSVQPTDTKTDTETDIKTNTETIFKNQYKRLENQSN